MDSKSRYDKRIRSLWIWKFSKTVKNLMGRQGFNNNEMPAATILRNQKQHFKRIWTEEERKWKYNPQPQSTLYIYTCTWLSFPNIFLLFFIDCQYYWKWNNKRWIAFYKMKEDKCTSKVDSSARYWIPSLGYFSELYS